MSSNPLAKSLSESGLSIRNRIRIALLMECTAIKAGNVHPSASFHDLTYQQFVAAAIAIGDRMNRCIHLPVGEVVFQSVKAMMERVGTNTSLGTILLIAPLAVAINRLEKDGKTLAELPVYIRETLSRLDSLDSECIYEAIRLAKPGGLGETRTMDIQQVAPESIQHAMKTAAAWDDIALQYATDFELVLEYAKRILNKAPNGPACLKTIRNLQIEILSERVDSLIARKRGIEFANQVQAEAKKVLLSGPYGSEVFESAWSAFDAFLRDEKHCGNPGTIADLIAAALFVALC